MHEGENRSERERTRMREGGGGRGEKVTVACRRVLDVVSGRPAWPVARGPWPGLCTRRNAARGPRRQTERKRERVRGSRNIGGVDSAKESKGERKPRGWAGKTRSLPRVLYHSYHFALPRLVVGASSEGLLLPSRATAPPLLLFLPLPLFSRSPALALVRAHSRTLVREGSRESRRAALSPGGWFRDVPLPRPSAAYRRCN